ncbi:MAG: TM1812 family CRISPR-associated protein [Selenomonadaceae bacterium]|nr:TM1812 family CRISPR-associated protein [Selenomonadaceae bacterium]
MEKNIMLAFVSPVSASSLGKPINYPDIHGRAYEAIQTNESAIIYVERMLGENSLSKIFLIVSDSVKRGKVPSDNEFGDVTHLEFLRRRIAKEFPKLAEKFSAQDYSEEGSGSTKLEKNILQIAKIADAVTDFARENFGDTITVHADITGGFRHTSMLMMSVIQLLRYRGIKIGEILYSDPTSRTVYRVTEIQRMFSLITGADEFVKFGSVTALQDYFGENPPPAVKNLLGAMNRFSEAIKICRTSAIEDELKNLGQHIQTFRENPDKDLKSELFAKIIDTIEFEYGKLIHSTSGRLDIIRWCMEKDFWQQAMTLCTEWLPEEIIARKIYMPRDSKIIKTAELEGVNFGRNWQQQLIIAYQGAEKSFDDNDEDEFCKSLRDVLENFSTRKIRSDKIFGELNNFSKEYGAGEIPFALFKKGRLKNFQKKFPLLAAALKIIHDERQKSLDYRKNFSQFLQTIYYEKIPKLIANLPAEKILNLFKIDRTKIPKSGVELIDKAETKWENREKIYREMFDKKIIHSEFDERIVLNFLRGYYDIRNERNQINHANAQASKNISDLKPMIESFLGELEKIKKMPLRSSRND